MADERAAPPASLPCGGRRGGPLGPGWPTVRRATNGNRCTPPWVEAPHGAKPWVARCRTAAAGGGHGSDPWGLRGPRGKNPGGSPRRQQGGRGRPTTRRHGDSRAGAAALPSGASTSRTGWAARPRPHEALSASRRTPARISPPGQPWPGAPGNAWVAPAAQSFLPELLNPTAPRLGQRDPARTRR